MKTSVKHRIGSWKVSDGSGKRREKENNTLAWGCSSVLQIHVLLDLVLDLVLSSLQGKESSEAENCPPPKKNLTHKIN